VSGTAAALGRGEREGRAITESKDGGASVRGGRKTGRRWLERGSWLRRAWKIPETAAIVEEEGSETNEGGRDSGVGRESRGMRDSERNWRGFRGAAVEAGWRRRTEREGAERRRSRASKTGEPDDDETRKKGGRCSCFFHFFFDSSAARLRCFSSSALYHCEMDVEGQCWSKEAAKAREKGDGTSTPERIPSSRLSTGSYPNTLLACMRRRVSTKSERESKEDAPAQCQSTCPPERRPCTFDSHRTPPVSSPAPSR
jgi:hypothetical protein